jgi:cysteine/O-acetylserine efflux protein
MSGEALIYILVLLVVGCSTPGPNNLTCTVHASVHGKRANIPLVIGMGLGFFMVHVLCGLAVNSFDADGKVRLYLDAVGTLFMFLIAGSVIFLARSERFLSFPDTLPKLGFKTGLLMQFVNGKEWAMVFMVMSKFLDDFGGGISGVFLIASITVPGGVFAMYLWTRLGEGIKHRFEETNQMQGVLTFLGLLLFIVSLLLAISAL